MKKLLSLSLVIILCFQFTACGGKASNVSQVAYDSATKTLETADQYLNGKIGDLKAIEQIDKALEPLKIKHEEEGDPDDFAISIIIGTISTYILGNGMDGSYKNELLNSIEDLKYYMKNGKYRK